MKKIIALSLVLFSLFGSLFAAEGVLSGEDDIRVTKTKWFDIIYPARCEVSAQILYENADSIYEGLGEEYGYMPTARLPVVITPAVEDFNGYYAPTPYNTIVLYDTAMIDQLEVFTETFLNLFRHECIHAYTMNMRGKFMDVYGKIFGTGFAVFLSRAVIITSGMAEAATVSGESAAGEGRLNNEYTTQMIKQAKIEDNFPAFHDVQGAQSVYPANSFYFFNGAFSEWLQKEYGMKKYGDWWYAMVNYEKITVGAAFKKVYGMPIKKAWILFEASVEVPKIAANPVEAGVAKDFFIPSSDTYSKANNTGDLYTNLTNSDKGIVYTNNYSNAAYFVSNEMLNSDEIKPEVLFRLNDIVDLKVSQDGRFVAVSATNENSATIKMLTYIYDMETGKLTKLDDHGFYHPEIVKVQNDYYLVRQGYESPYYTIKTDKLIFDAEGNFESAQDYSKKVLPFNVAPFHFTDLGDGTYAYVNKAGLNYSIAISDLNGNILNEFAVPKERMSIRYLSKAGNKLLFSWVAPGTMPRLGSFNLDEQTYALSDTDISGGVYYPVSVNNSIVYIGNFYHENRILTIKDDTVPVAAVGPVAADSDEVAAEGPVAPVSSAPALPPLPTAELPYEEYKGYKFFTQGFWLPGSTLSTSTIMPEYITSTPMDLGFTYMTGTPFQSNLLTVSGGYAFSTNSYMLGAEYTGGTDTSLFKYDVYDAVEFNDHGWKKLFATGDVSSNLQVGKTGYFWTEVASMAAFGKPDKPVQTPAYTLDDVRNLTFLDLMQFKQGQSSDRNNYLSWENGLSLGYKNVNRSGSGYYEKAGFSVSANVDYLMLNNVSQSEKMFGGINLGSTVGVFLPKLLPFDCPFSYCYNLPVNLAFNLFQSGVTYTQDPANIDYTKMLYAAYNQGYALASFDVNTLLFAKQIQKATFAPLIYAQRITVSLDYQGCIFDVGEKLTANRFLKVPEYIQKGKNGELVYSDYLALKTEFVFSPNAGIFINYDLGVYAGVYMVNLVTDPKHISPKVQFGFTVN